MIKRNNKKGFTIVELVIVIAVIAILAAVLIPTFSGIIRKANLSADQQAVRQMNTALAVDGAVTPTDIFKLHEVLDELGLTSEDYKPLTKDTFFFWDADLNRVLHVDENMTVITPAEYAGQTYVAGTSNWYSLTLEIAATKPADFAEGASTVTVKSGAEMQYVIDAMEDKKLGNTLTITVDGTIDMMGAAFDIPELKSGMSLSIVGSSSAAIKNATAVDFAQGAISDSEGNDGIYGCALVPKVAAGATVSISNIVIENMNVKNTEVSGAALLIGSLNGNATISDVTIKNSSVVGHRSVGALVGFVQDGASLTLGQNIKLENVDVMTVGGRSAMLIGLNHDTKGKVDVSAASISLDKDCSFGIYECAQNKGSYNGQTLGLDKATNDLYSTISTKVTVEKYKHFENALVTVSKGASVGTMLDSVVTGWN